MYEGPTLLEPGDLLLCYDSTLLDRSIETEKKSACCAGIRNRLEVSRFTATLPCMSAEVNASRHWGRA